VTQSSTIQSLSRYLGLVFMIFGLITGLKGFGDSVYAGWATSFFATGVSELLFGISLTLFGIGLTTFAKK
jgi:hypothetical protein